MPKNKLEKLYFDCDLVMVAFWYLQKKSATTKQQFTVADLFEVMKRILNRVDYINKNSDEKIIAFVNHQCEIKKSAWRTKRVYDKLKT